MMVSTCSSVRPRSNSYKCTEQKEKEYDVLYETPGSNSYKCTEQKGLTAYEENSVPEKQLVQVHRAEEKIGG